MNERTRVQVLAAIVIAVFTGGIWTTGAHVDLGWLKFYSTAVAVATAVFLLWDRRLWALPLAQRRLGVPRDIRGTWKGVLTSAWINPETGVSPASKTVYLVVRQTATSASAVLLTDESRSSSSLASVIGGDGSTSFDYMYLNRPHSRLEHRSRMHHGSTSLDVSGRPASHLTGRYWTDRDSKGELDFDARRKQTAEDYAEAAKLFADNPA